MIKANTFHVEDYVYSAKITSDLVLGKDFRFQTTGGYESPIHTITGKKFEYYYLDLGLRKSILKKKGSLYLKFADAFNNMERERTNTSSKDIISHHTSKAITRRVLLSFTYKFNKVASF